MSQKSAPQENPSTEVTPQKNAAAQLVGNFNFAELAEADAPEVRGFRLLDQAALEAVPFVIVGITVRDGVKRISEKGKVPTNYLSVECVTADELTLQRLIAHNAIAQNGELVSSLVNLSVRPNEMVLFNDGSTGVARQLVSFLHYRGFINVGDDSKPNGRMGESSFDRYHGEWVSGGRDMNNPDAADPSFYGSPLLKCMRGLRRSDYEAEATNADATTWYLG